MDAAAQLFFCQRGEPALDQVEPTGRSGREVQMEAGALGQPVANQLGFMGAVVVQNQMHLQLCRHVVLDSVEEEAKLPGAMPAVRLADDLAGLGIQRGEQAGGAVALVVMRAAFDLAVAWATTAPCDRGLESATFHPHITPARDPADRDTSPRCRAPYR